MEGPTPVSALLHAATMVTAGVFLLLRVFNVIVFSKITMLLICFLGCLSATIASIIAIFQCDLKKIVAYSTFSQLGYMFVSIGMANPQLSLFHLLNHAFFKAGLFLASGIIIHGIFEQDIRKMGGLRYKCSENYAAVFIGSITLCGFPFFSGFYSKDTIIELAFISNSY